MLEEVLVTAQKREERLADVPISISAYSGDALEARGVTTAADLEAIIPSMVYDNLVGYSLIYVRGVGTEVFLPNADASVATYVDGIYFPSAHGLAQEFIPIERIEVLKGPQGTLFGRNATGGTINVITKKPSEEWAVSLDATIGSFDRKQFKGFVSGPIMSSLNFSVAGMQSLEESYYEIAPTSPLEKLNDNESQGWNVSLAWQPIDEMDILLTAYETEFDGTFTVPNTQIDPTPLGESVGSTQGRPGKRETNYDAQPNVRGETQVYATTIDFRPSTFDVKLIAASQKTTTDTDWDYDNGPEPAVYENPSNQFSNSTSVELQFLSNDNSLWSEWLTWLGGFYYYESDAGIDPLYFAGGNSQSSSDVGDIFGTLASALDPAGVSLPESLTALVLRGVIDTESYSAFAQTTVHISDTLDLTLGARYQREERALVKSSVGTSTGSSSNPEETVIRDFVSDGPIEIANEDFSPRIALDWTIWDDTLMYLSWTQAFKSGTLNIVNVYTEPTTVDPEKTTAIEFGMKGRFLDGSLKYSAAIFQNIIEDLQTQVVSLTTGGLVTIVNAAEAEIKGAEFDITWQVFPESLPGLIVAAAAGYLDGEYTSFPEGAGFDEQSGQAFGADALTGDARDFSGNTTVRSPKASGSLGVNYLFSVPGGDLEVGVDGYYNSGYYFDTQNVTEQPEYYTVGARVSYFHVEHGVRISAFGRNLNDELYFTNVFPNDFGKAATYAPPTTYGLTLSYDF